VGNAEVSQYAFVEGTRPLGKHGGLLNPKTSILIQKRHSYTRNLNSETSGDSKNAFLHGGDVLGLVMIILQILGRPQ